MKLHPSFAGLIPAALFLAGCETISPGGTYVDPKGPTTIVSINKIDPKDYDAAATALTDSIKSRGVLENLPNPPVTLVISRIRNSTQQVNLATDSFAAKLSDLLEQTGKIRTSTTQGLGGRVVDPMARDRARLEALRSGAPIRDETPYFTLAGEIVENRTRAGNLRQVTYTFRLFLTNVGDGKSVWTGEHEVTKQDTVPAVGL
jgi:hypothetical protein